MIAADGRAAAEAGRSCDGKDARSDCEDWHVVRLVRREAPDQPVELPRGPREIAHGFRRAIGRAVLLARDLGRSAGERPGGRISGEVERGPCALMGA
jgi:hypothetical protein